MVNSRTINEILNLTTGEILEADNIFHDQGNREAEIFQLRTHIENQIQTCNIEYVCLYCKQPVAIRGRPTALNGLRHFYFTHPYNSDDCIIKTTHRLTEEQVRCLKYNGEKESELHNRLKHLIGDYLVKTDSVDDVSIDKIYKDIAVSKEWKRPDVLANYKGKKIAFELQLSTTFLSVIVARTRFYNERSIFLIWVFADFSVINDLQKFTQKDVYYNNNFNVYVFDKDAERKSFSKGCLVLKCYHNKFQDTMKV